MPRRTSRARDQGELDYKIHRAYLDAPEMLAEQLEQLMTEHARRANRAEREAVAEPTDPMRMTDAEIQTFLAQRAGAERARMLNEGYRHGLNKTWKLIFGFESFEDLKEQ